MTPHYEKLREEFYKKQEYVFKESDGAEFMSDEQIADWWLSHFQKQLEEVVGKIEEKRDYYKNTVCLLANCEWKDINKCLGSISGRSPETSMSPVANFAQGQAISYMDIIRDLDDLLTSLGITEEK